MNIVRKNTWLILVYVIFFCAVFLFGPGKTMAAGTDITSEEIMIGDMLYDRINPDDPERILLQKYVSPLTEHSLGRKYVTKVYVEGGTLPTEEFETYDSQPGLAGIVYGVMDRVLPFAPGTRLAFLHVLNGALYCLMLTILFAWASRWFSKTSLVLCAVFAALAMPHTFSFATNLYWLGWGQMLPMAVICLLLQKWKTYPKKCWGLFLGAFIPCAVCFLCQYEYVSDVCICLMVPILVQVCNEWKGWRQFWKVTLPPAFGAVAAFGFSVIYKLCLLAYLDGGFAAAWKRFMEPVAVRLLGKASSAYEYSQEASQAGLGETFYRIFKTPLYQIGGIRVQLWHFVALAFMAVLVLALLSLGHKSAEKRGPQICFAFLTFLAAVSWLILAKPHSYVHVGWAQSTFFMPFLLFLPAYWWLAAKDIWRFWRGRRKNA